MTNERRYTEDEVHEIFERAAAKEPQGLLASRREEGMNLADLQDIGRQVGLDAARIAEAAAAIDVGGQLVPRRTSWGMPVSVGRIVELERPPTDREWELLVAEVRQTFGARGRVVTEGRLREWRNGNLHVSVEPTETGYRLRMGTYKGNALATAAVGVGGVLMGLLFLLLMILEGKLARGFFLPAVFLGMGGAALASSVVALPRWAKEREEQMEYIARRATALIGTSSSGSDEESSP